MRLWHQSLIPQLPRAQLLGNTANAPPCAATAGAGRTPPSTTSSPTAPICSTPTTSLSWTKCSSAATDLIPHGAIKTIVATPACRIPIWRQNLSPARFMPNTMMITLPNAWRICAVKVLKYKDEL